MRPRASWHRSHVVKLETISAVLSVFFSSRRRHTRGSRDWSSDVCSSDLEILHRFGFPPGKIPVVVEVIRTHQPSSEPLTLEGIIVRDADILEQLGTTAVLRTVCKIGRDRSEERRVGKERSTREAWTH